MNPVEQADIDYVDEQHLLLFGRRAFLEELAITGNLAFAIDAGETDLDTVTKAKANDEDFRQDCDAAVAVARAEYQYRQARRALVERIDA